MNVLLFCGLNKSKVHAKLDPILGYKNIKSIYLVRDDYISIPKVKCITVPQIFKHTKFIKSIYKILVALYYSVKIKPEAIIGIYLVPHGLYSLLVGKIFGKKTILSMIGTDVNNDFPKYIFLRYLTKRYDHITITGSRTKKFLINQGLSESKLSIIPSYIDTNKFIPNDVPKKYDLIFIGTLNHNKRLDLILDAFSMLDNNKTLVVLGEGPLEKYYKSYAKHLGIASRVHFKGYKSEVRAYIWQSKILLLASEKEGLPQCVMEAMGCGIPCIVPDINDLKDLVVDKYNSLTFESYKSNELGILIDKLLSDKSLYLQISRNARQSIVENFSIENGIENWRRILGNI